MMFLQRYKQLIGRCVLLFLAGTALQLCIGSVDASFLSYPWGLVAAVNYLYLLIILYRYRQEIDEHGGDGEEHAVQSVEDAPVSGEDVS